LPRELLYFSNKPIKERGILMASRKMMQREVTTTFVKVAMIKIVDGEPKLETLPEEEMIGNVSPEQAQKAMNKKYGQPVTILEVFADTKTYEMPLDEFIQHATVKEEVIEEEV
jgi:hypothetical protein